MGINTSYFKSLSSYVVSFFYRLNWRPLNYCRLTRRALNDFECLSNGGGDRVSLLIFIEMKINRDNFMKI